MKLKSLLYGGAAALAASPGVMSQLAQFSPPADGVTYRVNIPESTASGSGPIYMQVEAPSDIEYVALGQGQGMAGAHIFVVYASSDSNVTVSPRLGLGHFDPEPNPETQVTVLDGSGIADGKMIANFRCDNCLSWEGGSMDPQDTSSSWIWSMKQGEPIRSSDTSESIQYHDIKGGFTLDLSNALSEDFDNPFLELDPENAIESGAATSTDGVVTKRSVHGLIMSIVFVVLFPSFALTPRLIPYRKTISRIHAPLQLATLSAAAVGFGFGISMAVDFQRVTHHHPIIGIVVIGSLFLFQPALGLFHHLRYRKTGQPSPLGIIHRWLGRAMIVLAIINGGLGFRWAGIGNVGVPQAGVIAYIAVAGVMGILYTAIVLWDMWKSSRDGQGTGQGSPTSSDGKGWKIRNRR